MPRAVCSPGGGSEQPGERLAAPGSLFSVCSLLDSKTIGVPTPSQERKEAWGRWIWGCQGFPPSEHGPPRGPGCRGQGQGQASVPSSPPLVLGSCHLARPDSFRPYGIPGLGSSRVGGCHWAPATCVPTLGASDPAVLS